MIITLYRRYVILLNVFYVYHENLFRIDILYTFLSIIMISRTPNNKTDKFKVGFKRHTVTAHITFDYLTVNVIYLSKVICNVIQIDRWTERNFHLQIFDVLSRQDQVNKKCYK